MTEIAEIVNHALNGTTEKIPMQDTTTTLVTRKKFVCTVCGRDDFKNQQALGSHVRYSHNTQKQATRVQNHPANRKAMRSELARRAMAGEEVGDFKPNPLGLRTDKLGRNIEKRYAGRPAGWLTALDMIAKYPGMIRRMEHNGIASCLKQHPEWKETLMGRGEPKQTLYDAINQMRYGKHSHTEIAKLRKQHRRIPDDADLKGPRPVSRPGRPAGIPDKSKRTHWSKQQYDLCKAIFESGNYRAGKKGKSINWTWAFSEHPDWAKELNYSEETRSLFLSFAARVRTGGGPYHHLGNKAGKIKEMEHAKKQMLITQEPVEAVPVDQNGKVAITVAGHLFTLEQLEAIVIAHQNKLEHVKFCPECGYNQLMHNKAYTIAKRHSQHE